MMPTSPCRWCGLVRCTCATDMDRAFDFKDELKSPEELLLTPDDRSEAAVRGSIQRRAPYPRETAWRSKRPA